eukprot:5523247-Lingulodinium_polyedra.AAC.1
MKEAVAKFAGEGGHGRNARVVLDTMSLLQQRALAKHAKHANAWVDRRVSRYWQAIQATSHVLGLN